MMFKAEVRNVIAERKNEVIVAIVARAEELARLGNQVGHLLYVGGSHGQRGFAVGGHVNLVMNGLTRRRDVDDAEIFAADDGRIDQKIERNGLERNRIARLTGDGKRRAELPSLRKDEFGIIRQFLRGRSGRIERNLVPLQNQQLVGGGAALRLNVVVGRVELADAGRDVEMEGEGVKQVALPGNDLAIALEFKAGEAGDGTGRTVLAWNPLGVVERERPGLNGQHQVGVQELLWSFGCIHRERDSLAGLRRRGVRGDGKNQGHKQRYAKALHWKAPPEGFLKPHACIISPVGGAFEIGRQC